MRLWIEPDDGVRPVLQFIGAARQTLDVAVYLLSDREIMAALQAAVGRGVRVRVLMEEHPYGTGPGNGTAAATLKKGGAQVTWGPPGFRFNHEKYAIRDGQAALVGTANWAYSAFTYNREYLVEDTDPTDIHQLSLIFEEDWKRQPLEARDVRLVVSPINARSDFMALIGSARRRIDLESEELQDPGIEDALVAASQRGVEVRLILPFPSSGRDSNAVGERRVIAGGVKVHRLRDPRVHAKDIVVDQHEGFVGSENISTSSLDDNREVGVLIVDPRAIQIIEGSFDRDWNAGQAF